MEEMPTTLPDHDGTTYDSVQDKFRLNSQLYRVFEALSEPRYWTLAALSKRTGDPEASVSARIRDLRKLKFGGFSVESTRLKMDKGTWVYRLISHGRPR